MRDFLAKGEKAAFLTRDLIIKLNSLKKILREERRLGNHKLINLALKEAALITDKIYDHVRIYDVNGKLATIDLQSIEVTQQQQTMDLQNESSICNFYNNVAAKRGEILSDKSFSGPALQNERNAIIGQQ